MVDDKNDTLTSLNEKYSPLHLALAQLISEIPSITKLGIKVAVPIVCFICVLEIFRVLAGNETIALFAFFVKQDFISIEMKVKVIIGSLTVSNIIAWIAFGKERYSHKKTIKDKSKRITTLETMIDPQRSSSGITETGEQIPRINNEFTSINQFDFHLKHNYTLVDLVCVCT
jgi:hypothetical protein